MLHTITSAINYIISFPHTNSWVTSYGTLTHVSPQTLSLTLVSSLTTMSCGKCSYFSKTPNATFNTFFIQGNFHESGNNSNREGFVSNNVTTTLCTAHFKLQIKRKQVCPEICRNNDYFVYTTVISTRCPAWIHGYYGFVIPAITTRITQGKFVSIQISNSMKKFINTLRRILQVQ